MVHHFSCCVEFHFNLLVKPCAQMLQNYTLFFYLRVVEKPAPQLFFRKWYKMLMVIIVVRDYPVLVVYRLR